MHVFIVLVHQILGDQQAALVGQTCFKLGQAKNTSVSSLCYLPMLSFLHQLCCFGFVYSALTEAVQFCIVCSVPVGDKKIKKEFFFFY